MARIRTIKFIILGFLILLALVVFISREQRQARLEEDVPRPIRVSARANDSAIGIRVDNNNDKEQRVTRNKTQLAGAVDDEKRNFIKEMMKHAWRGYVHYAWGFNQLRPISKQPHTENVFGSEQMGATIVDAIDTLHIMGLQEEYQAARGWIEQSLNFSKFTSKVCAFELNIRFVGSLLAIHALTGDQMFLDKAKQVADRLLVAFDTPTGIPLSDVNLATNKGQYFASLEGGALLSEFGSFHLEFAELSHQTGHPKYLDKVLRVREVIKKAAPRPDGLYNSYINTETGQWLTYKTHVSIGAEGDSFYEYLLKAYVQSDGRDVDALQMYLEAMQAFENKLLFKSTQSGLDYFADLKENNIEHRMGSLACFSAGMLALGSSKLSPEQSAIKDRHMNLARGIANTCHEASVRAKSQLAPEVFVFTGKTEAVAYGAAARYYILRPEVVETYFYLWRYTHEPIYRQWAWDFVQALEEHCRCEAGYSGILNVYEPYVKDDIQQSFLLAEVFKYLYLIFSDDDLISLDQWVFNTEAHPLPIIRGQH